MKLVFDTYALMTYLRREPSHDIVRSLLVDTLRQNHESYMSVINIGELFYMRWRKGSQADAESSLIFVRRMGIHIEQASNVRVMNAARIKAIVSLSYADAFAAALAEELNATLVTGDREYKPLESKINILWL